MITTLRTWATLIKIPVLPDKVFPQNMEEPLFSCSTYVSCICNTCYCYQLCFEDQKWFDVLKSFVFKE